jgi:type I restriction enzyme S subunit
MTPAIDITTAQRKTLLTLLRQFIPGVIVWAYGSRAKWTARPNSDLDLVAFTTPAQSPLVSELKDALAESNLPFTVDLHVWDEIPERFHTIIRNEYVVLQEAEEKQLRSISEWREGTIADVAAPSKNALVGGPFGSNLVSRDYTPSGVPVIRGQNMGFGRWVGGEFVFVSEDKAEELSANIARPGDLVFTQRGTLGQVAIVPPASFDRYIISQSQMKLTVDPAKADAKFLFYFFTSEEQQDYIRRNAIQTGVPHTNLGHLRTTPLLLLPLSEQREIASVLGSLDDKIELNRRMNETLEALAQSLFKSWFVDATQSALPKGWRETMLDELATISGGKQLPTEECKPSGKFTVFGANGIMGYADRSTHEGFVIAFGRVGAYCGSIHWAHDGAWINNNASSVVPHRWPEFVLQAMLNVDFAAMRTGSAQPFIPNSSLSAAKTIRPTDDILDSYCSIVRPLRLKQTQNEAESRTLAALRDALLPKLLSGELRMRAKLGSLDL